ncbi:MAG: hypothetical protein LBQ10_10090, partial [Desulfovibrio sp.]|nr:hypothetical protein [Desulfovibrio sp.]
VNIFKVLASSSVNSMLLAGAPISVLLKWIYHIYFMNAILGTRGNHTLQGLISSFAAHCLLVR